MSTTIKTGKILFITIVDVSRPNVDFSDNNARMEFLTNMQRDYNDNPIYTDKFKEFCATVIPVLTKSDLMHCSINTSHIAGMTAPSSLTDVTVYVHTVPAAEPSVECLDLHASKGRIKLMFSENSENVRDYALVIIDEIIKVALS